MIWLVERNRSRTSSSAMVFKVSGIEAVHNMSNPEVVRL